MTVTVDVTVATRPTHCEVCDHPLTRRGRAVTGLCRKCLTDGAAFARGWAEDLRAQGLTFPTVASIIGTTEDAARVRLTERRRARSRS